MYQKSVLGKTRQNDERDLTIHHVTICGIFSAINECDFFAN